MNFEETLYLRDDEADEFGDSGAFNDSLEEDYEEEEEEEEAPLTPSGGESEPVETGRSAPAGGGPPKSRKPAKKKAPKKAAKKKAPKKAARKTAKKKAAKKRSSRGGARKRTAKKKGGRRR